MDFDADDSIPEQHYDVQIMKHIHETWAFLVKRLWNFGRGRRMCIMSMEARMTVWYERVTRSYSFCARCSNMGKYCVPLM